MEQHTDSVTTTRTTRMIYVEEISDTERRNSMYKSFEAETNVEEIMKSSTSAPGAGKSPGKASKPNAASKKSADPALEVSKKIAELTSPLKSVRAGKNSVVPAEILSLANGEIDETKAGDLIKATEPVINDIINNEKNALMSLEKPAEEHADVKGESSKESPVKTKVASQVSNPNGEVPETPKPEEAPKPTQPNGDVQHITNGDVVQKVESAEETKVEPANIKMEDEVLKEKTTPVTSSDAEKNETLTTASQQPIPTPIPSTDIEKGALGDAVTEIDSPLPEMKKFSKHNSLSSMSSASGSVTKVDEPNDPPTRRSTRRNLLQSVKSKRKFATQEEEKTIKESLLYETLKPLLFLMKCTGIFFIPKKGQFGKSFREVLRSCTAQQIYCLVMCGLLFLNFLRSMLAFDANDGFSNALFLKFLTAIFMYESSSRAALAYWHSYRKTKGLQQFFLTLEKICYSDKIIPYETDLKRVMHAAIIISIVISLSNMGSNAYGMFNTASDQFDSYLVPVPPNAPGIEAMKTFVLVMLLINGLVAMLSLSFFTTVCYVLYKEFEYLCRTFVMKIRDDGSFTDDLEKFRITHQKRCKLVEDADSMFKYYIANTYMTNVPLLCMLLYVIVYAEGSDVSYRLINAFRLFYVLVQMVVVSCAATMINNQAHAPLGDVYSINVHSATSERQLEVNMFLNKLTGTQIGMTAWDMFVINKPTVLTVVGMVLTYFFLLVQFKNPLGEPTQCRCMVNASSDVLRSLVSDTTTELMTYSTT